MFTSVDKAWTALIMAALFIGGEYFGVKNPIDSYLSPEIWDALKVLSTAFMVWVIPNKQPNT